MRNGKLCESGWEKQMRKNEIQWEERVYGLRNVCPANVYGMCWCAVDGVILSLSTLIQPDSKRYLSEKSEINKVINICVMITGGWLDGWWSSDNAEMK